MGIFKRRSAEEKAFALALDQWQRTWTDLAAGLVKAPPNDRGLPWDLCRTQVHRGYALVDQAKHSGINPNWEDECESIGKRMGRDIGWYKPKPPEHVDKAAKAVLRYAESGVKDPVFE